MNSTFPFHGQPHEMIVLRDLLRQIGAQSIEVLGGGGSPARVLRVTTHERASFVLKYLFAEGGRVDGHDLDTFWLKATQIQHIATDAPFLRPFYISIVAQFHGANWSAYLMPYYPGVLMTASLWGGGGGPPSFFVHCPI